MNEIKVTVELCEEDRKLLESISASVTVLMDVATGSIKPSIKPGQKEEPTKEEQAQKEEPTKEEPAKKEEPTKEAPAVTMEQVQAMVQKLATPTAGFRDQVRTIVKEYADRVSQIPQDKLPEVMDHLKALTKEG